MDKVEKAYLAGIVDGEGTVTLAKHHRNETPSTRVSVSSNELNLLKWIKKVVDGGTIISKRKNKPHHAKSYVWSVCHNRALRFLGEIKDYLIIKKQHAELITKNYKSVTPRNGRYTSKMLAKKDRLVAKIRKLNQR